MWAQYNEYKTVHKPVSYTHLDVYKRQVLSLAYLLGVLLFVFDLFGPLKALYGEATRLTVMNACLLYTSRCV